MTISSEVLIAIDPGVTTGIAIAMMMPSGEIRPLLVEDTRDVGKIVTAATVAIRTHGAEAVIVEDFVGGGFRSKETKQTIEMLGFIKIYYGQVMEQKVVVQQPQFRKHAYQESCAILKQYSFKVHHAKDAFAHLIAYCIKEKSYEKKFNLPSD